MKFVFQVHRIVQDLYDKTCASTSVTASEKQFQDAYLGLIDKSLETLRTFRSEPRKAWTPFKQVIFFVQLFMLVLLLSIPNSETVVANLSVLELLDDFFLLLI